MKMRSYCGLALAIFVSVCAQEWVGTAQPSVSDSAVTEAKMLKLDGVSLRVRTAGLDRRRAGQPVVVFESGGGSALETWDPIFLEVAKLAPVVAYDRAGTGKSTWDAQPPTPERITARLRSLLSSLNVDPPYVLVGHSWGGALIRYFAGAVPKNVIGLVYLDPTDITQSPADEKALFESIGAGASALEDFYAFMERSVAAAPAPLQAEAAVTTALFRQDVARRKVPPVPEVPATVILAGRPPTIPAAGLPFDAKKYAEALYQLRLQRLRAWVRAPGEYKVAEHSGHFIHRDEPQVVLDAIRRLLLM
jgi:pimeloyl-ACP methyl ester carboxylesterase